MAGVSNHARVDDRHRKAWPDQPAPAAAGPFPALGFADGGRCVCCVGGLRLENGRAGVPAPCALAHRANFPGASGLLPGRPDRHAGRSPGRAAAGQPGGHPGGRAGQPAPQPGTRRDDARHLVKSTPLAAIAPLLFIWLGFGILPKIIITALPRSSPRSSTCWWGCKAPNAKCST